MISTMSAASTGSVAAAKTSPGQLAPSASPASPVARPASATTTRVSRIFDAASPLPAIPVAAMRSSVDWKYSSALNRWAALRRIKFAFIAGEASHLACGQGLA